MKYQSLSITLLLLYANLTHAQYRPIGISSYNITAIAKNFDQAALWSNRKLDKYGNDTIYGSPTFQKNVVFNGTNTITGGTTYAGAATFTGSTTFNGYSNFSKVIAISTSIRYSDGGESSSYNTYIGIKYPAEDYGATATAGYTEASKFIAYETFTAKRMGIRMYQCTNGIKGKMAIYVSSANYASPTGSTVAATAEFTCNGINDSIYISNLTSPYTFTSGSYYWLAFVGDTDTTPFRIVVGGAQRNTISQYVAGTYANGFPNWTTTETGGNGIAVSAFP